MTLSAVPPGSGLSDEFAPLHHRIGFRRCYRVVAFAVDGIFARTDPGKS